MKNDRSKYKIYIPILATAFIVVIFFKFFIRVHDFVEHQFIPHNTIQQPQVLSEFIAKEDTIPQLSFEQHTKIRDNIDSLISLKKKLSDMPILKNKFVGNFYEIIDSKFIHYPDSILIGYCNFYCDPNICGYGYAFSPEIPQKLYSIIITGNGHKNYFTVKIWEDKRHFKVEVDKPILTDDFVYSYHPQIRVK